MTKPELYEVLEALKSAEAELRALVLDFDAYTPSGTLLEQLESAVQVAERAYTLLR